MKIAFVACTVLAALLGGCGGNVEVGAGGAAPSGSTSSGRSSATGSSVASTSTGGSTSSSSSVTSASSSSAVTSASSSATSSTSSSSGGCGSCSMPGFECCGGACVNSTYDPFNCGACGHKCGTGAYCHKGMCEVPPCSGATCGSAELCCGMQCCAAGQLCCDIDGPVALAYPQCTAPSSTGTCPAGCTGCVCAAPDTPIATPDGERPISELAVGDLVYSVEGEAIVAVPIARVNRAPVRDHHVVRVRLATGSVLEISPRHPTADGRTFGDLRAGDALDATPIVSVELVAYAHPFTYDIRPASETHTYFAGGALIGTTLPAEGSTAIR